MRAKLTSIASRKVHRALLAIAWATSFVAGCAAPAPRGFTWGTTDYDKAVVALQKPAEGEMAKPLDQRAKDAGVTILDYATACLASGRFETAQKAFYQGILLTNDMTLRESDGDASLVWDEATKVWQGEGYERASAELLHGVCLMYMEDYDNARVAFDRALICDKFSKGALAEREGTPTGVVSFSLSDEANARGGSVFQRDFLAAYVLRTLCYIHMKKLERARKSWQEATDLYRELLTAAQGNANVDTPTYWTADSGRYQYPNLYLPPFNLRAPADASPMSASDELFSKSVDDLAQANCLLVAASGSRPKKVKVGNLAEGTDANFIHDDYLWPAETIQNMNPMIDGRIVGPMTRCLNLYGQAAGRGPSAKDIAQERKGRVEDVGRALQNSGNNYLKILGSIVRAVNQEEADTRQWTLLPNAIHLWIGRIDPQAHRIALLPTGENKPSIEPAWNDRNYGTLLQTYERVYMTAFDTLAAGRENPLALRHGLYRDVPIKPEGLTTVFMAEAFNANVVDAAPKVARAYELLPRRQPGKS